MEKFKELISLLYESRDKSTIFHFNTDSEAHHKEFDTYAINIAELLDSLVEKYIGKYGNIGEYGVVTEYNKESDYTKYFTALVEDIETNKNTYIDENDTFLHSVLDDIIGELYSLLYKLKNIK